MVMKFTCVGLYMTAIVIASSRMSIGSEQIDTMIQEINKIPPNRRINEIPSEPFRLITAEIDDDILSIDVEYRGSQKMHEFVLYWNGIVTRSYPGQTQLYLKHNTNDDAGESLITKTLRFRLTALHIPMIITLRGDSDQSKRIEYGVVKRR